MVLTRIQRSNVVAYVCTDFGIFETCSEPTKEETIFAIELQSFFSQHT